MRGDRRQGKVGERKRDERLNWGVIGTPRNDLYTSVPHPHKQIEQWDHKSVPEGSYSTDQQILMADLPDLQQAISDNAYLIILGDLRDPRAFPCSKGAN